MKFNFSFTCLLQTGHTALQRAAAEGHLEIVKTLLENGISVDHQDEVVSDKNYEVFDANIKFFVINIMSLKSKQQNRFGCLTGARRGICIRSQWPR